MDIRMQRKLLLALLAATGACFGATTALAAGSQDTTTNSNAPAAQDRPAAAHHGKAKSHAVRSAHHRATSARWSENRYTAASSGNTRVASSDNGERATDVLFDHLDLNHDGVLSRNELQHDRHLASEARSLDRDHDGTLSRDELAGYRLGGR